MNTTSRICADKSRMAGLMVLLIAVSGGSVFGASENELESKWQQASGDRRPIDPESGTSRHGANEAIGYRYMSAISKFSDLNQIALLMRLPRLWRHELSNGTLLEATLSFESGLVTQKEVSHLFVSAGPLLRWSSPSGRLSAEVGLSPTLLEGTTFAERDLGGHLHFTSHAGVAVVLGQKQGHRVALRLQHISNGGISSTNPGLDMFGIEYEWRMGSRPEKP